MNTSRDSRHALHRGEGDGATADNLIVLRGRALALLAVLGHDTSGGRLLGQQNVVDVGQHTAGRDGHIAQQLVQFFVVADRQLDVAGDDAGLLVVARGVAGKFQDFSAQVFQHGGEVHGGTATDALGEAALLQETGDTTDGELEAGLGRTGRGLAFLAAAAGCFSFTRHVLECT
ncbi:hypothetical protein H257_07829 [Aphanomyces astaci]|uniref:Uncharacterized protein n=1 Tax=Aphanomyces astaci TaxID=112090 RepID=W4GJK8_APHAT|nr:hypothetical protein H257_07829 [Aphanomyces astaci]ETV79078.1 hypothetical protein H257_07829 [Aphanomyces astaci]|eukprot:XP_009831797.1 hypothetical protein H257_07829 [Aphanomyces astaci]